MTGGAADQHTTPKTAEAATNIIVKLKLSRADRHTRACAITAGRSGAANALEQLMQRHAGAIKVKPTLGSTDTHTST